MDDLSSVGKTRTLTQTDDPGRAPLKLGQLSGLSLNTYSLNFSLYNNIMRYKNQAFTNRLQDVGLFGQPVAKHEDKSRSEFEINSEASEVGSQLDEIETRKQQILGPVGMANLERDIAMTDRKLVN